MYEDITAETVLTLVRGSWIKNKNDGQTYEIASFSPEHNGYEVLYNGVTFNISGTFVREIASMGGDVSKFVFPSVEKWLVKKTAANELNNKSGQ